MDSCFLFAKQVSYHIKIVSIKPKWQLFVNGHYNDLTNQVQRCPMFEVKDEEN